MNGALSVRPDGKSALLLGEQRWNEKLGTVSSLAGGLAGELVNLGYTGEFDMNILNLGTIMSKWNPSGKRQGGSMWFLETWADTMYKSDADISRIQNLGLGMNISKKGISFSSETKGWDVGEMTMMLGQAAWNQGSLLYDKWRNRGPVVMAEPPREMLMEQIMGWGNNSVEETVPAGLPDPKEQVALDPRMREGGENDNEVYRDDLAPQKPMAGKKGIEDLPLNTITIDWAFIQELEGYKREIYVPGVTKENKPGKTTQKSGPTIASGFDIGQGGGKRIRDLNLEEKLENRLIQYTNKKAQEAIDYVYGNKKKKQQAHQEIFTDLEITSINRTVKKLYAEKAENYFNEDVKDKNGLFINQPAFAQTVFTSVYFQYGAKIPKFKKAMNSGNHGEVVEILLNFTKKDKNGFVDFFPRRAKEANYILSFMENSSLKNKLQIKLNKEVMRYEKKQDEKLESINNSIFGTSRLLTMFLIALILVSFACERKYPRSLDRYTNIPIDFEVYADNPSIKKLVAERMEGKMETIKGISISKESLAKLYVYISFITNSSSKKECMIGIAHTSGFPQRVIAEAFLETNPTEKQIKLFSYLVNEPSSLRFLNTIHLPDFKMFTNDQVDVNIVETFRIKEIEPIRRALELE